MSEIIKERLEKNIGKNIKIFLKNDFRFKGILIKYDETFIEILDDVKRYPIIIRIDELKELFALEEVS